MHFYKRGREGWWIHGHRHVYENCAKRGRSERREQTFQNKKGVGRGRGWLDDRAINAKGAPQTKKPAANNVPL